jgi:hypothetical protein
MKPEVRITSAYVTTCFYFQYSAINNIIRVVVRKSMKAETLAPIEADY